MSRTLRLVLATALLLTNIPFAALWPPQSVYAQSSDDVADDVADDAASNITTALNDFTTAFGSLAGYDELGEPIPFLDLNPSEQLRLDELLKDALDGLGPHTELGALGTQLESMDRVLSYPDEHGNMTINIAVAFDNVQADDGANILAFDFVATRTVNATTSVTYDHLTVENTVERRTINGPTVGVTLTLRTSLAFGYTPDNDATTVDEEAVYLTNAPIVTLLATADVSTLAPAERQFGFTTVTAGGSLLLNALVQAAFADPDGDGRLTDEELTSTALGDLVTVAFVDQPGNDIDGQMTLEATLIDNTTDATITWQIPNLAGDRGNPSIALGDLEKFNNVTAEEVFSGLASATIALRAAQQRGDMDLPFLKGNLSELINFASPLEDLLHQLGDAAIICGTEYKDGVIRGSVFGLGAGAEVHCQALALAPGTMVEWRVGTSVQNNDSNTVGPKPTAAAKLTLDAAGMDSVELTYTPQGESEPRTVRPLFLTAQELAEKLQSIAHITTVPVYDPASQSLTFHLHKDFGSASKTLAVDFGDQLAADTALTGLSQTEGSQVEVAASDAALDVIFGILLVEDKNHILPNARNADRFFLKVNPGVNEFKANLDVQGDSAIALKGRLAFLEITATGISNADGSGNPIFDLTHSSDRTMPATFALELHASGITTPTLPSPIPDAILLTEFLAGGIGNKFSAVCEASLYTGLAVAAPGIPGAAGEVAVSWEDIFADDSCTPNDTVDRLAIDTDGNFADTLYAFNIDGENPLALLSVVLDSITGFAQAIDKLDPTKGDLNDKFPLVGVSPRELLDSLEKINEHIDHIRKNPPDTLQALKQQLATELGIDANHLSFSVGEHVSNNDNRELRFDLVYNQTNTLANPLNLQLRDNGLGLVAAEGSNIAFTYNTTAQLNLALPLVLGSKPTVKQVFVLHDSHASVAVNFAQENFTLNAAVGPLALQGLSGVAKLNAALVVQNGADVPLTEWATNAGALLTGSEQDCGEAGEYELKGHACASITLDPTLGTIGFYAPNIAQADSLEEEGGWYVVFPPALDAALNGQPLDLKLLFTLLPQLADKVEGLLAQGAQDVSVPGLGDALDAGANVATTLRNNVSGPLNTMMERVNGGNVGKIKEAIARDLPAALGDLVDPTSIMVTAKCVDEMGNDVDPCEDGTKPHLIKDLTVQFTLRDGIDGEQPFNIGIDGLPVATDGTLTLGGGWSLRLTVGLNKELGPYLVTGSTEPELRVRADAGISGQNGECAADSTNPEFFKGGVGFDQYSPTDCLEATLGFLSAALHDRIGDGVEETPDETFISVVTTLDLTMANDAPLTAVNIINSAGLKPQIDVDSHIDLAFRTGIGENKSLPSVIGTLLVDWEFGVGENNYGPDAPTVKFDKLYVGLGTFANVVLDPALKDVRKVTSPLEPIVDFMQSEVPVLAQLADLVGQPRPTVLDVIKEYYGETDAAERVEMLHTIIALIKFANTLNPDDGTTENNNTWISLRQEPVILDGAALLKGGTTPDNARSRIPDLENFAGSLVGNLPGNTDRAEAPAEGRAKNFGVEGLTFPFLERGSEVFSLLLGQDVAIVRMDFGSMSAFVEKGYEYGPIFFGPFPVTAEIGLGFGVEARFAMGYSSRGLRLFSEGDSRSALLQGLFIDDLNLKKQDVDEWRLVFAIKAEAALDAGVAEAGIFGKIESEIVGDLKDPVPDGKVFYDEIDELIDYPLCIFEVSGALKLFLGFYVEVDTFLWSDRWEKSIINVTLLDFSEAFQTECAAPKEPVLAEKIGKDLYLNIGTRADERGILTDEKNEEFTVRQTGTLTFSVEAFGIKQEKTIEDGGRIIANAADGDDIIALVAGGDLEHVIPFTTPSELIGGEGNDSLTGGDAQDTFYGDGFKEDGTPVPDNEAGADTLIGGIGDDRLYGNGGPDRIDGGLDGDMMLDGGAGDDTITGGPGGDIIVGGTGGDSLLGGPWTDAHPDGDDTIFGDESVAVGKRGEVPSCTENGDGSGGNDVISGGPGNDTLVGGYANDMIIGNEGNDKLCGNGGNDTLDGDDDVDQPNSPDGSDRDELADGGFAGGLYGGSGNDTMFGRGGDDFLAGGNDHDTMFGNEGADTMLGEAGNDIMNGNADNDRMDGGGDHDTMRGHDGDDTMQGASGEDTMYGDAGEDTMYGNEDNDTMRGGDNTDRMAGNSEDDKMYGDAGDDFMFGNEDNDTMYGNGGQDDMVGGSNTEKTRDGNDTMHGGTQQDVMVGDNGQITRPGGNAQAEVEGTLRNVTLHDLSEGNNNSEYTGEDTLHGGNDNDDLYGGGENDTIHGNAGDDHIEGNGASDTIFGDAGQDDLIGGTTQGNGGQPDAGDEIYGGADGADLPNDFDVIAGDNAQIVRVLNGNAFFTDNYGADAQGVVRRVITLFDVATTTAAAPANSSGGDTLVGEGGFDILYGQGGNEVRMSGGSGNDEMYGNAGDDLMLGNNGQDDLIGGTGRTKSDDPASAQPGRLDGSDTINGGSDSPDADTDDYDVIMGDNATIFKVRASGSDNDGNRPWVANTYNDAITRQIRLYDVAAIGQAAGTGVSGGDRLRGEDHDDLLYGQGGDDTMEGGSGEDYMEGNAATDTMSGNQGNDDMVGGTGRINDDPATGVNGRLDANDTMDGNEGFDVMAGDNALLVRKLVNGEWQSNNFNDGIQHEDRILLDENSPDAPLVSGGDTMRGGDQDDLMYGQAGNDNMDGNAGDDFMEGNSDNDTMQGGPDQDDMIGGTVLATIWDGADTMYGGATGDVMAGDNATIQRPLTNDRWQIEPNTQDEIRTITLFNVEVAGAPAADPLLSGSDTLSGNEGSDRIFGQSNDDSDDDGDGLFNEDPDDGIDNDMDGRESSASTQYDCADGADNDGDDTTDADDPDCTGRVDEDGGGDVIFGNEDDDFIEGNHGADFIFGNEGEDDIWGGSSSDASGVVGSGTPPDHLVDTNDILRGGEEDDLLIGDNGIIVRNTNDAGIWQRHQGARANGDQTPFDMVMRTAGVTQTPENPGAFGNDWIQGNDGEDEAYGQQGNDYIEGNNGEDALLGDLGLITSSVQDGSNQQTIAPPGPFFEETIYPAGSFHRQFTLFSFTGVPAVAGNDIILGGDDRDSLHGADGNDILNGDGDAATINSLEGADTNPLTLDVDKVFGGDGGDVMWGGRADDNLWGGYGDDYLDVRPRRGMTDFPDDPPVWHTFGRFDFYQGLDLIYGGWHRDAMQANVAAPGPRNTDRLIDWAGGYNVFYVCPGAYGEGTITRQGSPHLLAWMQQVIDADGALNSATANTSGFREFAYVFPNERGANSHPPHPDHPGHFTCDDGSTGESAPDAPEVQTMHIGTLNVVYTPGRNRNFRAATAQIMVVDANNQPVAGATVRGAWSNATNATLSCTSGNDGACTMAKSREVRVSETLTFTILDVTHESYTYDPTANAATVASMLEEGPSLSESATFLPFIQP